MNAKKFVTLAVVSGLLLGAGQGCSTSPKTASERTALASSAAAAMDGFRAEDPSLQGLLNKAAGWVIFPEVGKAGFVVGGSYGHGEVFEHGAKIGYADITQGTVGLQVGAQTFSELLILMRDSDVDAFKRGKFSLAANASAVAIKPGAAATTDTAKSVIVFVRTTGGLMAEAAVGGQGFSFKPL